MKMKLKCPYCGSDNTHEFCVERDHWDRFRLEYLNMCEDCKTEFYDNGVINL